MLLLNLTRLGAALPVGLDGDAGRLAGALDGRAAPPLAPPLALVLLLTLLEIELFRDGVEFPITLIGPFLNEFIMFFELTCPTSAPLA